MKETMKVAKKANSVNLYSNSQNFLNFYLKNPLFKFD